MIRVELLSKADCPLCEKAKAVLEAVRREHPFELVERDIAADPDLYDRYRIDIPVVRVAGVDAFKHRVDARAFAARLRDAEKP